MLTPADIEGKQFSTTRLREGYDPDEVDTFLDRVVAQIRQETANSDSQGVSLRAEIKRLKAALDEAALRAAPPADPDAPSLDSIKTILVAAQKTAEQCIADGNAQSGRTIAEATANAQRSLGEARAEAQRIVGEAHVERQAEIDRLTAQIAELKTSTAEMTAVRQNYQRWMKSCLESMEAPE